MEQNFDIPLHDIKPLVDIEEYSFEYLMAFSGVLVLIFIGLLYLVFIWLKNKKRYNKRKEYAKRIKALELHDTKAAAYKLTHYGAAFKADSPRHAKAYEELFAHLEAYKYKKDVTAFSEETLHFIEIYRGMIDE